MRHRRYSKGKATRTLIRGLYNSTCTDSEHDAIEWIVPTDKEFAAQEKQLLKSGWKETEWSLSLRVLLSGKPPKNYWKFAVDQELVWVDSGKVIRESAQRLSRPPRIKYFDSHQEALAYYHREIAKKLKEGFREYEPRETAYSQPPADNGKPARRRAASVTSGARSEERAVADPAGGPRQFTFQEGSSDKFWNIALDGNQFTVQWGRTGTAGQSQTKNFPTDEAAQKAHDKLIAEKTGKGYVEQARSAGSESAKVKTAAKSSSKKGKAPTATKEAEASPASDVVCEVTRRINLAPEDWFAVTWREIQPLVRPAPPPFDLDAALNSIRDIPSSRQMVYSSLPVPKRRHSPEEAAFWFEAVLTVQKYKSFKAFADALTKNREFENATPTQLIAQHEKAKWLDWEAVSQMVSLDDWVEMLIELDLEDRNGYTVRVMREALPYFTLAERAAIRKKLEVAAGKIPKTKRYAVTPQLAAVLGCHNVARDWCDHLHKAGQFHDTLSYVLGLGSRDEVISGIDAIRKGSKIWYYELYRHERSLLAHLEYTRLDLLVALIRDCSKSMGEKFVEALALVEAPEAAPLFLELRLAGKQPKVVNAWLNRFVGNSIAGLLPVAAGKGTLATAAQAYLKEQHRAGHGGLIDNLMAQVTDGDGKSGGGLERALASATAKDVDDKRLPAPLKRALMGNELPAIKGVDWLSLAALPPLMVAGGKLSDNHVEAILRALAVSTFTKPEPLLALLEEHVSRESLEEFLWGLFGIWQSSGAPLKHRWAMGVLGLLGGDETAVRLAPLIRKWPGESQHQRAVFGLDCLRAIGTDVALMQLSGIAQKVKFKGLQRKAVECVEAIAAEKGLTRHELEDRVVPDCGLDERGRREFDFGPRKFTFALGGDLKPMVRDEDGKLRGDLPAPGAKDDAALAKPAVEAWKELKKQIRDTAKLQAVRLEQALVTGRRWKPGDFETLLVKQPLMTHLVRPLFWAGYDAKGKRTLLFRVTDEQDFADAGDKPVKLDKLTAVGVVHPLDLSPDEARRWGEVFSDYSLAPPFQQLGRPTFTLSAADKKHDELLECQDYKPIRKQRIPAISVVGTLERLGWTRGPAQDNGVFMEHYKQYPAADVTACINYEGIAFGMMTEERDQEITDVYFVEGMLLPKGWPYKRKKLKLSAIDAVVVSETLADLRILSSKAK